MNSIREIVEKILSFLNPGAGGAVSGGGQPAGPERAMSVESSSDEPEGDFSASPDWEDRVLCPDESCVGIIGPDGRCTECGRAGTPIGNVFSGPDEEKPAPVSEPQESDAARVETTAPEPEASDDGDWEKRVLCPDESCIGIIGADGRCTECGKRHG